MIRRRNECFSKKLNTELLYDPALPLLGIYPKETKTLIQKEIRTPTSIALFTVARIWKQPKHPSIKERIKKLIHTHTHTHREEYYSVMKKNVISNMMDLEVILLSEITLSKNDEHCMMSLICEILKNTAN